MFDLYRMNVSKGGNTYASGTRIWILEHSIFGFLKAGKVNMCLELRKNNKLITDNVA